MEDRRRETGRRAEDICAEKITSCGWRLIERNWRIRAGEIDLIALDRDRLVFIEVKALHTRLKSGPALPALAVDQLKQRRLRRLGEAWLAWRADSLDFGEVRFDVVGVLFSRQGEVLDYQHIENAF